VNAASSKYLIWASALAAAVALVYFGFKAYLTPSLLVNFANLVGC
jgi:hypothetical protein